MEVTAPARNCGNDSAATSLGKNSANSTPPPSSGPGIATRRGPLRAPPHAAPAAEARSSLARSAQPPRLTAPVQPRERAEVIARADDGINLLNPPPQRPGAPDADRRLDQRQARVVAHRQRHPLDHLARLRPPRVRPCERAVRVEDEHVRKL